MPHPQDPNKTLLKQEAVVTVEGVPLNNYVEDLLTNRISLNAGKVNYALIYSGLNIYKYSTHIFVHTLEIFYRIKWYTF